MHVIFVEPAQYTLDLIRNVYSENDVDITFLNSDSKAVSEDKNLLSKAHYCDQHSLFSNFQHFISVGFKYRFVISNGYTHWPFRLLFLMSLIKKLHIGIESDTPYSESKGIKKLIKSIYLKTIFSNKSILGLSGGNGAHMDLFLKYGMDKYRVFLMPMMIDNQKYYPTKMKIPNKVPVFLYVGRLDPVKKVDMLIDAFKNKLKENTETKLIIVGAGSCEDILKKQSKLVDNIEFKGKLFDEELIACYHQADVLVLPSVFEPWGLVVNEALSAGLAVLCSNAVGAADDLVKKPDAGWVFETGNQDELEELLVHCAMHPQELEQKAQNGVAFMRNSWNYDNYKQSLHEIKKYVTIH